MKSLVIIKTQKGSVSIILALVLSVFALIIIAQAPGDFKALNKLHKNIKESQLVENEIYQIANLVKNSFDVGQMDSACSSTGGNAYEKKVFMGNVLCIPKNQGLCIGSGVNKICVSTTVENMNWKSGSLSNVNIKKYNESKSSIGASETQTRLVVPNTTNTDFWKTCSAPAICLRLVICSAGQTNCTLEEAQAIQTIRLGDF